MRAVAMVRALAEADSLQDTLIRWGVGVLLALLLISGLVAMLSKDPERRKAAMVVFMALFGVVNVTVEFLRKVFGKGA